MASGRGRERERESSVNNDLYMNGEENVPSYTLIRL